MFVMLLLLAAAIVAAACIVETMLEILLAFKSEATHGPAEGTAFEVGLNHVGLEVIGGQLQESGFRDCRAHPHKYESKIY